MTVDQLQLDTDNFLDLKTFTQTLEGLRHESPTLRKTYITAQPYPHLVIDNLFEPNLLDRLITEFPQPQNRDWLVWDTTHESKTTSRGINGLSTLTQMFCLWLNSTDVIKTIESIVGMDNLVALLWASGNKKNLRKWFSKV